MEAKKKTALTTLIDSLNLAINSGILMPEEIAILNDVIEDATNLLQQEKDDLIEAFTIGYTDGMSPIDKYDKFEDYYTQTFEQ